MPYLTMQYFPLKSAYLCQDCNSVGNSSRQCPACASGVLMGLAAVLDREVEEEEQVSPYGYLTAMVA
jgi:ribosomal protein S27AE